jgi:hypothetical protein
MSQLHPTLEIVMNEDVTSLINWSILLSLFKEHQSDLTYQQKIEIYKKCESYREYWNSDRKEKTTHTNFLGEKKEIIRIKHGLGIEPEDIYDNAIYRDKDILSYIQNKNLPFFQHLIDKLSIALPISKINC